MKREIRNDRPAVIEPAKPVTFDNLKDWLQEHAAYHKFKWLLAHADDGVIWGRVDNGKLISSDSVVPDVSPPLRAETLQQARLFSEDGELLLWRDADNKFYARVIRKPADGEIPTFTETIDEPQILWGTDPTPKQNGFTMMSDGAQGLRHAVPLGVSGTFNEETRPLRLRVRHYLQEDATGFNRIVASRLFALTMEGAK